VETDADNRPVDPVTLDSVSVTPEDESYISANE